MADIDFDMRRILYIVLFEFVLFRFLFPVWEVRDYTITLNLIHTP